MSDATDTAIAQLRDDVTNLAGVEASAVTLLNGLSAQLKDALDQARNKGATPDQLAALNDLHATLSNSTADLAAAVVADTPVPEAPPAPPADAPPPEAPPPEAPPADVPADPPADPVPADAPADVPADAPAKGK